MASIFNDLNSINTNQNSIWFKEGKIQPVKSFFDRSRIQIESNLEWILSPGLQLINHRFYPKGRGKTNQLK